MSVTHGLLDTLRLIHTKLIEPLIESMDSAVGFMSKALKETATVNKAEARDPNLVGDIWTVPDFLMTTRDFFSIFEKVFDFFRFPVDCLVYKIRERFGSFKNMTSPPSPPWASKFGLFKFILATCAFGLGITVLAMPGLNLILGVVAAGFSLVKAVFELGKELKSGSFDGKALQKIALKTLSFGIAIIGLAGAVLLLSNPFVGAVLTAIGLGLGIGICLYKLAHWAEKKYTAYKNKSIECSENLVKTDVLTQEPAKEQQKEIDPSVSCTRSLTLFDNQKPIKVAEVLTKEQQVNLPSSENIGNSFYPTLLPTSRSVFLGTLDSKVKSQRLGEEATVT